MSKVCLFLNGIFRIAWGPVFDKLGFRIPYTIICVTQVTVSATFFFGAKNKHIYFILNILENFVFAGHGTIAPPLVTKIFGIKNAVILIGIAGYFLGTFSFMGALLAKFVISETKDFLIVYLTGAAFATMGLIITLIISEKKFEYKKDGRPDIRGVDDAPLVKESIKPGDEAQIPQEETKA